MAIEKSFFSQYGWEVPDAYYKIDGWRIMNEEENSYEFAVGVYRNVQARNDNKEPITTNLMRVIIDRGTFDVLELWVNVSVRTSGNIVFNVQPQDQEILPYPQILVHCYDLNRCEPNEHFS